MKKIEALKRARDALLAAPTAYRAPETIAFIDEALAEQPRGEATLAQQPAQQPICGLDVYLDPNDGLKPKLFPKQPAQQQEHVALTDIEIQNCFQQRSKDKTNERRLIAEQIIKTALEKLQ